MSGLAIGIAAAATFAGSIAASRPQLKLSLFDSTRGAVQLDRPDDRRFAERKQPALVRVADHEQVRRDRIAHQAGGELRRVEKLGIARRRRRP